MKTKTNILFSLLAMGLVGGAGTALGQTTAVTDPAGYHTLTVLGNGGAPSKFSAISVALTNKVDFAGCADTITATEITVAGDPLTDGDFASGYYVTITDGAGAGAWTNVTGNTANTISTEDDLTAFAAAGSCFAIRRHVTIGDIFATPDDQDANGAGLDGGSSVADADVIIVVNSELGSQSQFYFSDIVGFSGWINNSLGVQDPSFAIEPGQGLLVERKVAGDVSWIFPGHVKVEPTIVTIDGGAFNVEQVLAPVGFTLDESGLTDALDGGSDVGAADNVLYISPTGELVTYYYSDIVGFDGWVNNAVGLNTAGTDLLPEGSGILVNRKNPASSTWTLPAPTIAP